MSPNINERKKYLNQKGFTLLEVLIVMIVLSYVLVSMFELLNANYMTMGKELEDQETRDSMRLFTSYMTKDVLYSKHVKVENTSSFDLLTYEDYQGKSRIVKFVYNKGIYEIEAGREKLIAKGKKFDQSKPMVREENGMIIFNVYAKEINALLDLSLKPRIQKSRGEGL